MVMKKQPQISKSHQPQKRMSVIEKSKQFKVYSSGKDQVFNLRSDQNSDEGQSRLVHGMNGLDLQANILNTEDL